MNFNDVIRERFSCKKFDGRKVSRNHLDAILEAGKFAPTAKNLQEHHIYVLESKEALEKFDAECPCRYNAATVLIVAFDKNNVFTYPGDQRTSGVEDATIVATHLMLAAKNQGVESCWINFFDPDKMAKTMGFPENEEILMALDLGYPAEDAEPLKMHFNRKELSETVSYL